MTVKDQRDSVYVTIFLCKRCLAKCENPQRVGVDTAGCAGCGPGTLQHCVKVRGVFAPRSTTKGKP